jgi:threonine/homoserine/homoserine lactone efflux protein
MEIVSSILILLSHKQIYMTDAIVSGLLLGFALVFSVGPVIFTIIKLRVNYGIASALYFTSGVWLSDLLLVVAANFFGNWLGELFTYKRSIGTAGGIFLIGLGLFYLFFKKYEKRNETQEIIRVTGRKHTRLLLTGFLINTLNPSVIALWLAASTNSITMKLQHKVVLFTLCLSINIAADILKVYLAGKLKTKLNEKNITWINRISGLLFVAFGMALLYGSWKGD